MNTMKKIHGKVTELGTATTKNGTVPHRVFKVADVHLYTGFELKYPYTELSLDLRLAYKEKMDIEIRYSVDEGMTLKCVHSKGDKTKFYKCYGMTLYTDGIEEKKEE